MFVKRFLLFLVVVFTVFNMFFISTFAARAGEVERGYVEFEALAPDDFVEPIEIQLTHKEKEYVLHYYLYKVNNYFSNESVPCGDYYVSVNVGERQDELGFVYENSLLVESVNLASSFRIIIDYASLEGDASTLVNPDSSYEDEEKADIPEEKKEDVEKHDSNEVPDEPVSQDSNQGEPTKSPYALLISFAFSLLLIVVAAFALWKIKNR